MFPLLLLAALLSGPSAPADGADATATKLTKPPFPYLPATAYHVLPGTHNNESGYFSLSESQDGKLHIGTTTYGENCYLVEFDPKTAKQRIVVDVHKLCGLTDKGYAAQAKLHTRNFVGKSGKVYVGSKQGYRLNKEDTADYPGGYVIVYDPKTDTAENWGMPRKGQGVIDVVADENLGVLYVVTCEDQHWMMMVLDGINVRGPALKKYREIGPMLTPYATTLVDKRSVASAITKDFQLAQYKPPGTAVSTRPIMVDGKRWTRANDHAIPCWNLAADGKTAYLVLLNDPTLLEIDLTQEGEAVTAINRGKLIDGKNPDSRCALTIAPDGRVYTLFRVDNTTGFGTGYLHHLTRFDPKTKKIEDLGVVTVKNPDFFDFNAKGPDGKPKPYTHGFHKLPDGTLTLLHVHMALLAGRDGTLWATTIYPFTLLKIELPKVSR